MVTIHLDTFQRSNLLEFLKRTPLKGDEVGAFSDIVVAIQDAKDEPENTKEKTYSTKE